MQNVYSVGVGAQPDFLFTTPELAVQSIRLSYHKVAKTVPNGDLTQCTLVWDDKRKSNTVIPIKRIEILNRVEHL